MSFQLKKNPIKQAIQEGRTVCGMYVATPSPAVIELAGLAGLDFVRIDWAHAAFDLNLIENMVRAAECQGVVPFVRLEMNQQNINSLLEMGVMGVIIPDVSDVKSAQNAVQAAKFSPIGDRGMFSMPRKTGYGQVDSAAFKKWTNEEVFVCIQIESLEAIENLASILEVPGIDMVLSGRSDLSNALGVPGQKNHPLVLEAEEKIFRMAKEKGIAISPQIDPTAEQLSEDIRKWNEKGAYVISLGLDLNIFKKSLENIVSGIHVK